MTLEYGVNSVGIGCTKKNFKKRQIKIRRIIIKNNIMFEESKKFKSINKVST